jgi:hypothetical protein
MFSDCIDVLTKPYITVIPYKDNGFEDWRILTNEIIYALNQES